MRKLILTICALFTSHGALASGGMIGGGDVTFRTLMACDATSIDTTYTSSPYVWVVKEVHYSGKVVANATLRVMTVDKNLKPVRYYVSNSKNLTQNPDYKYNLELFRYETGSAGNYKIGSFIWDAKKNSGLLISVEGKNDVEELLLSNCVMTL